MKKFGRIPLLRQTGDAQGTKKWKKGYDRKRGKALARKEAYRKEWRAFYLFYKFFRIY